MTPITSSEQKSLTQPHHSKTSSVGLDKHHHQQQLSIQCFSGVTPDQDRSPKVNSGNCWSSSFHRPDDLPVTQLSHKAILKIGNAKFETKSSLRATKKLKRQVFGLVRSRCLNHRDAAATVRRNMF